VTAALAAPAGPARAQPVPPVIDEPSPGSDTPVVHDGRLDDDLAAVPLVGAAMAEGYARYRRDQQDLRAAQAADAAARAQLAALADARARLDTSVNRAIRRRDKAARQLGALRRAVAAIAVEDYVRGDGAAAVPLDIDPRAATDARSRRAVTAMVRGQQIDDLRAHNAAVNEAAGVIDSSRAELDDVTARQGETTAALDDAVGRQQRFTAAVAADARAVGDARLTSDVRGADFPLVALDAYYRAAKRLAGEAPACRIRWSLLAGIGKTESGHGTFRGATLDAAGAVTRAIIGIPLDGTDGTARITDTDGGRFDGDTAFDRAVGPMQFIPSTWRRWGRDGNGDGRTDPQNLYDAALTAAVYLCNVGSGLDGDAGMRDAVFGYNQDGGYVDTVVGRAHGYDLLSLV
jgi:membrane-bound lytic murein transglycosylase B